MTRQSICFATTLFAKMDARIKSGHDEKGKRRRFPKSRGRGLTVASRHANRTTVL
jgi:hypothetical protein